MTERIVARLGWSAAVAAVVLLVGSTILYALRVDDPVEAEEILLLPAFAAFAVVGAVIVSRQPRNIIGRLFLLIGLSAGIAFTADSWVRAEPTLPARPAAAAIAAVAFVGGFVPLSAVLLLFPHGTLPSSRWRVGIWLTFIAGLLIALGNAVSPTTADFPEVDNPLGMEWVEGSPLEGGGIGWLISMFAFLIAAAAVVVRYRRSEADDRRRLGWLMAAAAFIGVGWILQGIGYDIHTGFGTALKLSFYASLLVFPVLVGVAIVKHRLFDIDVVISRTLVFGALAAFITVVYVAIVVGIGALVGAGEEPSVGLQIAATAVVAVAFQPVRQRAQRLANRLVFGERATPYDVMTEFADRIGGALSIDAALPQIVEAAARGVGATSATVRLFGTTGVERAVTWPSEAAEVPDDDRAIDVVHAGERVGSIAVAKRAGEELTSGEEALLADVAAQAGLALRNVRLTVELEERLRLIERQAEQLRGSRQRLVTARDVQRRRLERDIREGAQQQLERIGGRLREATDLVERDDDRAAMLLEEIEAETGAALDRLRDLARGVFPPLLAEQGVAAALEAHIRKLDVPGWVTSTLDGARFDEDVEAAVYFCCVQAIQNSLRHAPGSRVDVTIERDDDGIVFAVRDDGTGFDPQTVARGMGFDIMQDRMEALGGTLHVDSSPGVGTVVTGRVPTRVAEAVPS